MNGSRVYMLSSDDYAQAVGDFVAKRDSFVVGVEYELQIETQVVRAGDGMKVDYIRVTVIRKEN